MNDVQMNSTAYAKKLRTRVRELQTQRKRALAVYYVALVRWRSDLETWLRDNVADRVSSISKSDLRSVGRYSHSTDPGFSASRFFAGSPRPPKYPDDEQLRRVQATLRHLAITGQAKIRVTLEDTNRLFGDGEDE